MGCCTCERDEPVEILPMFTTLVGESSFTSVPIDVSGKDSITLQVWRGPVQGDGEFSLLVEQSANAEHWTELNPGGTDPGSEGPGRTLEFCPRQKWFRVRADVTGEAQVTCWAEATIR